ncbi:MAG: hypothetical protein AAFP90_02455 [Planctomycetota bacterium]
MKRWPIHDTMQRLKNAMSEMQISFAIAGAMATNAHGHRRTTEDVDIPIRQSDLQRFKEEWIGRGYANKFEGSKDFRDAISGVNIDVLLCGRFPGDGKERPVSFSVSSGSK